MKILHITPQKPSLISGGEMCVYQSLISMKMNGYTVDYVGPEIENDEIKALYHRVFELAPTGQKKVLIKNLAKGVTNKRYEAWKNAAIDFCSYDRIWLEFTKLDYIFDRIRSNNVYVRVHNVEYDYAGALLRSQWRLKHFVYYLLARKQEKRILTECAGAVALTVHDVKRMTELYHIPEEKISLMPICVSSQTVLIKEKSSPLRMLITGSLWYIQNENGIKWFLENVCSKLSVPYELVIAGRNPSEGLMYEVSKRKNVTVMDSPPQMKPYFEQCDVVIAPVFEGGGMKVKVAEALSYGKPIIGTSHAFVGYESLQEFFDLLRADSAEDFVSRIQELHHMSSVQWISLQQKILTAFKNNYSFETSANNCRQALESLRDNKR